MVTLADGRPAFVGGDWSRVTFAGPPTIAHGREERTADIYDPALGTWSETPPMADSHILHAAVALPDGSLLLVGGASWDGKAERLMPVPVLLAEPAATPAGPGPAAPGPVPVGVKRGTLAFVKVPKRLRASRTATVTITLRCGGGACRDRLVLRRGRTTLAQRDVIIAAGRSVTVRLKLDAATRRTLRRRALPVALVLVRQQSKRSATLRAH
jgi:hypothetical protein